MSRNACENRRNGNDFHSSHRKQNSNFLFLTTSDLSHILPKTKTGTIVPFSGGSFRFLCYIENRFMPAWLPDGYGWP